MGSGRAQAISNNARPPRVEPVKPTARIDGWRTRPAPASTPRITEMVDSGAPDSLRASAISSAQRNDVLRCPSCALTRTGQPAARADAVSPPATENANGKLLAP